MQTVSMNLCIQSSLRSIGLVERTHKYGRFFSFILTLPISAILRLHCRVISAHSTMLAKQCVELKNAADAIQIASDLREGVDLLDENQALLQLLEGFKQSTRDLRTSSRGMFNLHLERDQKTDELEPVRLAQAYHLFNAVLAESEDAANQLQAAIQRHDAELSVVHAGHVASSEEEVLALLGRITAE